jgi:hypothetical protein
LYAQVQAWRQVLRGSNAAAAATATLTSSQADASSPVSPACCALCFLVLMFISGQPWHGYPAWFSAS